MTDETLPPENAETDTVATPEPPVPRGNPDFPDLRNWGGLRKTKAAVRRSATIMANREAIAYELLAMASTKITDLMTWDEAGNVKVRASNKIDERHARMIKSVKQTFDKDGNVQSFELVMYDKVGLLRTLAMAAGLMRKDEDEDKPAVVGVTLRGPKKRKTTTVENDA
jgi:hypothetical protein